MSLEVTSAETQYSIYASPQGRRWGAAMSIQEEKATWLLAFLGSAVILANSCVSSLKWRWRWSGSFSPSVLCSISYAEWVPRRQFYSNPAHPLPQSWQKPSAGTDTALTYKTERGGGGKSIHKEQTWFLSWWLSPNITSPCGFQSYFHSLWPHDPGK